jgi:hypothetical protein
MKEKVREKGSSSDPSPVKQRDVRQSEGEEECSCWSGTKTAWHACDEREREEAGRPQLCGGRASGRRIHGGSGG